MGAEASALASGEGAASAAAAAAAAALGYGAAAPAAAEPTDAAPAAAQEEKQEEQKEGLDPPPAPPAEAPAAPEPAPTTPAAVTNANPMSPVASVVPASPNAASLMLSPDQLLIAQLQGMGVTPTGQAAPGTWDAMEERMMKLQSALIMEEDIKTDPALLDMSNPTSRLQYLAQSELKVGVPEDSLEARLAALSSAMEGSDVSAQALAAAEEAAKLEARAARMREREAKRAAKRAAEQAAAAAAGAAGQPASMTRAVVAPPGTASALVVQMTQEAVAKKKTEEERRKAEEAEKERLRLEWEAREEARKQLEEKMMQEREEAERKHAEQEKRRVETAAQEAAQTVEREKAEAGSAYNVQNAVGRDEILRQLNAIAPRAADVSRLTVMLSDNLPDIVCSIMGENVSDLDIQDVGCQALKALVVGEDRHKMRAASEKAMDAVCAALEVHGADAHFQLSAFGALSAVAVHIPNKVAVVNIVLAGLSADPDNAPLAEVVCAALKNSALGDDVHRANAAKAGAITAILNAIRAHGAHPGVLQEAWAAVKNLAVNAENQVLFADAGAVELVLESMKALPRVAAVQEQAVWAIRIMSFRPENNKAMAEAGGVAAVVDAMRMHVNHAGVQETCCGCLRTLAVLPDSKLEMVEKGVFVRAVAACRAHIKKASVQIAAAGLLSALVTNPDTQNRAASAGVIEALVEVLTAHVRNAKVQQACLTILSSLTAANPGNKARAAGSGAVEAAVQALHVHANLTPLAEACCDTLASIVNNEASQIKTLEAKGIEAILAACRAHPHRPNLQEKGCKAMTSITWCQPPAQRRAREMGVLKDIATALSMYPDHKGVQKQARALMQTIQVEEEVDDDVTGVTGAQMGPAGESSLFGLNIRQPNYRYHTL